MLYFIFGFVACYIVFLILAFAEYDIEDIVTGIACGIAIPFVWVAMWPYVFFRSVVKPIPRRRFEEWRAGLRETSKTYHLFRNIYLHHDKETDRMFAHWFFIRVKEEN